ncbi:MAG: hypothetical protein AABN95_02705 [Acidobacteriota bacterium]
MVKPRIDRHYLAGLMVILCLGSSTLGQTAPEDEQFGPVVRAYLGYLRNEQHVVDDRASRREVNREYYRRNSNRIRALRQIAIQIAEESQNDYLPELEAVAADEFRSLFEHPPKSHTLQVGDVLWTKFRYIGRVRSGEVFYVFARLDPYEQAELMTRTQNRIEAAEDPEGANPILRTRDITRARRVNNPE